MSVVEAFFGGGEVYMVYAIVLAGGAGRRMETEVPKQLLPLHGRAVIWHSLHTFQEDPFIDEILLVTRKEDIAFFRSEIVDKYRFTKVRRICPGGEERYLSVYNGLQAIDPEAEPCIVMIHDGARPFVTHRMIEDSVQAIRDGYTACTVGMPVKDTIKVVSRISGVDMGTETPERSSLYQIQTPQTFTYALLKRAYERLMQSEHRMVTDDTMVVEAYGGTRSRILPGAYENIKITTPEDLVIAEAIAAHRA